MILSVDAERFAVGLHARTGLDVDVCRGWVLAEGNGGGAHNWLNVRGGGRSYSGVKVAGYSAGGFTEFATVDDAVVETAWWVNRMSNYAAIRSASAVGAPPAVQLSAVWRSPWDAGHYGGDGRTLIAAYARVKSNEPPSRPAPAPLPGPVPKPRWFWAALKSFLARGGWHPGR